LSEVHTVRIERQNLNERHENRRLTRKTCAFSKKAAWLVRQLNFHQTGEPASGPDLEDGGRPEDQTDAGASLRPDRSPLVDLRAFVL